jgi:2-hydroxychromene-2-carboxylate isomerase
MPTAIDFYFDFSSPYGYIASRRIDEIAARWKRAVAWRPFLLGVAMKVTGARPLSAIPMRDEYHKRDFARCAHEWGIPFAFPTVFPVSALAASRAFYWLEGRDPTLAKLFARAVFHAYFVEGRDVSTPEVVADVAGRFGVDRAVLLAALGDPAVKARLREETDKALARGVFGSPFLFVDGEPFWGQDRLAQIEHWLERGGW